MPVESKLAHGEPLPANPYPQSNDRYTAYESCRRLEGWTAWNAFMNDFPSASDPPFVAILDAMPPIIAARVLGYGLLFAPNDIGRDALVRDILACTQPELGVLAHLYVFGLVRVFHNPKGPTPAVTPAFTPRLSLEADAPNSHLVEPSSSNAAELRALILLRDDHRCVFTGRVDTRCYISGLAANVGLSTKAIATSVAHIISQLLTENMDCITLAHRAKICTHQ
ncbi:hypothetical protein C8Q70DRAFT_142437 [Cubamyces menziesii]|nr:hypothetical protein C8Q70DRAFT_142437 [Cubamyces menziesii]